ncbi:protein fluG [Lasiosphaeria ovina]|uniref:Protein fluG n=1 Tax=Lasiosphaeria ovina TaxID=92902 RepID=A0AAE0NAP7_9PEZI|nr:protein fluG [Lasiosphaeria ovina]
METGEAVTLVDYFLRNHPGIEFIRLQWVDYSSVLRTRAVTKARCRSIAAGSDSYSLAQNCMVIPVSTAPQCSPDGIEPWSLRPDWRSLTVCSSGGASKHHRNASVMCFVAQLALEDPFARCRRKLLSDLLDDFSRQQQQQQHNQAAKPDGHRPGLLMGFEIEFVLLDSSFDIATLSALERTMTTGLSILEEIVWQLESVQETIRTVCLEYQVRATTAPRPVLGGGAPKSGCHVHLSLNDPTLGAPSSFLAGAVKKVKPLCAFGLANYDSYCRVVGDCAGEWVGWGTRNKDLPICQVGPERWEFRFLDTTANVYLFIAALLAAGKAGLRAKYDLLPSRDCNLAWLGNFGITEQMPKTLREALDAAKDDTEVQSWVGRELFTQYIKVKEKEVETFGKMTDQDRRRKILEYF